MRRRQRLTPVGSAPVGLAHVALGPCRDGPRFHATMHMPCARHGVHAMLRACHAHAMHMPCCMLQEGEAHIEPPLSLTLILTLTRKVKLMESRHLYRCHVMLLSSHIGGALIRLTLPTPTPTPNPNPNT